MARTPRGRLRGRAWAGALGVALVLVMAGFLFAANARLAGGLDAREPQDLAGLVQVEIDRLEEIEAEVNALQAEVDRLTDVQTADLPQRDPAEAELEAFAAGRVAVSGPGLTVRLTDASASAPQPDWVTNDMLVVHQQDLQAVINALWAGGAEAMSLQGERVVATSAFRCVGNVLLLHDRAFSPPFVVRAIGDSDAMRQALRESPGVDRYLEYVKAVGLGWSVTPEEELELAEYGGPFELEFAEVPEGTDLQAGGADVLEGSSAGDPGPAGPRDEGP